MRILRNSSVGRVASDTMVKLAQAAGKPDEGRPLPFHIKGMYMAEAFGLAKLAMLQDEVISLAQKLGQKHARPLAKGAEQDAYQSLYYVGNASNWDDLFASLDEGIKALRELKDQTSWHFEQKVAELKQEFKEKKAILPYLEMVAEKDPKRQEFRQMERGM